jgi:maltooligosyltrehalose trehalohydrolase
MLFMGEEWGSKSPFLFFTHHHDELADAVREGRRKEFAHFTAFADPARREKIPDPNAPETFAASIPEAPDALTRDQAEMLAAYEAGLQLRAQHIVPRLPGAASLGAAALSSTAIRAAWQMGDGAILTIASNLGAEPVEFVAEPTTIATSGAPYDGATLPAFTTYVWLQQA